MGSRETESGNHAGQVVPTVPPSCRQVLRASGEPRGYVTAVSSSGVARWRLALVLLLGATAFVPLADAAKLQLEIVDAYGQGIRRGLRASVYNKAELIASVSGGGQITLSTLPDCECRLEITGPGFRTLSRSVTLTQITTVLRVGLDLAKVGDPVSADLDLSGRVDFCSSGSVMWVKMYGVFTNMIAETNVKGDCGFKIADVPGGRYAVLLVEGDTVRQVKVVTLTAEPQTVVFTTEGESTVRKRR